jgi:hypothetical protein
MKTPEGRFTGELVASVGGGPAMDPRSVGPEGGPAAPAPPEGGPGAVAHSKAVPPPRNRFTYEHPND